MEIKGIPSYASEFEFIICYKGEEEDPDSYYFYSVEENGWMAEQDCEELKADNFEPIVIHNVRIQGRKK